MSDESATTTETPATTPAKGTKRARRVSTPRSKKVARASEEKPAEAVATPAPEESKSSGFPEFPENAEVQETPSSEGDREEPEAVAQSVQEGAKRKRRRKKAKGSSAQNAAPQPEADSEASVVTAAPPQTRPNQAQRPKLDAGMLAKFAWKIYLAEISEEGVALVGDNDARELSRRCFRLAEIFMEEEVRRR